MERMMHDARHIHGQTERDDDLAARAKRRLLSFAHLSALEQNRAAQQMAVAEDWKLWPLGGFRLSDGSVLWRSASGWQSFSATEACARLDAQRKQPLEVRLLHTFEGVDGREKCSIAEAHFSFLEHPERWRLVIEYEAFMDSPLYGFEAERFEELLELNLWDIRVDTPQPGQRWWLEQIALHPDWLELLNVSRGPD